MFYNFKGSILKGLIFFFVFLAALIRFLGQSLRDGYFAFERFIISQNTNTLATAAVLVGSLIAIEFVSLLIVVTSDSSSRDILITLLAILLITTLVLGVVIIRIPTTRGVRHLDDRTYPLLCFERNVDRLEVEFFVCPFCGEEAFFQLHGQRISNIIRSRDEAYDFFFKYFEDIPASDRKTKVYDRVNSEIIDAEKFPLNTSI